ncbi:hypothetical protein MKW94_008238 [Papaver nudicaule]|uniref:F-box domain-containing protein n=1 Tax=Papaver nudicaule TaxID=74823 RepID=A0AA41VIQ8_PAPNU|nr:hypothetical protein [Papaver nudicaule]
MSNLPGDCLNLILKLLNTKDDRNSFGLTCRHWFHVQNNSWQSLHYGNPSGANFESFSIVLHKLLSRFPNLKSLFIMGYLPQVTDLMQVASKPPFFESKVQFLSLVKCHLNSDVELSLMFSWFPRLTSITLSSHYITDMGLETLAKCCPCLEIINLFSRLSITDTGISFLIQNCRKLGKLRIRRCRNITEGIEAIVSGGGLECLLLCDFPDLGVGYLNTEAVVTISKGCPSLKKLQLSNRMDVELEGWEAIGRNCKNLEYLYVYGSRKLCDLGLQAMCNGCNKLSKLVVSDTNCCSRSALELFKSKKPNVMYHF